MEGTRKRGRDKEGIKEKEGGGTRKGRGMVDGACCHVKVVEQGMLVVLGACRWWWGAGPPLLIVVVVGAHGLWWMLVPFC